MSATLSVKLVTTGPPVGALAPLRQLVKSMNDEFGSSVYGMYAPPLPDLSHQRCLGLKYRS